MTEQIRPGCLTGRSQTGVDDEMLPAAHASSQTQVKNLAAISWWDRQKGLAALEWHANN